MTFSVYSKKDKIHGVLLNGRSLIEVAEGTYQVDRSSLINESIFDVPEDIKFKVEGLLKLKNSGTIDVFMSKTPEGFLFEFYEVVGVRYWEGTFNVVKIMECKAEYIKSGSTVFQIEEFYEDDDNIFLEYFLKANCKSVVHLLEYVEKELCDLEIEVIRNLRTNVLTRDYFEEKEA